MRCHIHLSLYVSGVYRSQFVSCQVQVYHFTELWILTELWSLSELIVTQIHLAVPDLFRQVTEYTLQLTVCQTLLVAMSESVM